MNTKEIGRAGEEKAVQWLIQNNFKIIDRNFSKRGFEIDIIAEDANGILRFVEVKTIVDGEVEDAFVSLEARNMRRYFNGVEAFICERPIYKDRQMAMDVMVLKSDTVSLYTNITGDLVI